MNCYPLGTGEAQRLVGETDRRAVETGPMEIGLRDPVISSAIEEAVGQDCFLLRTVYWACPEEERMVIR